jgi:hypothetical protein
MQPQPERDGSSADADARVAEREDAAEELMVAVVAGAIAVIDVAVAADAA